MALAEGVQAELVCDLSSVHGIGEILLVGEHQQHSVAQLVLHRDRIRTREGRARLLNARMFYGHAALR